MLASDLAEATPPFISLQQFPSAYVVSGTWVSGPPGDFSLPLLLPRGEPVALTVHEAVITFQHATATQAAGGIISGVVSTDDLVRAFASTARRIAPTFCANSGALTPILDQIKASQDILSDGTNRPGVKCDAISIGLAFTADAVGQPTRAYKACPLTNRPVQSEGCRRPLVPLRPTFRRWRPRRGLNREPRRFCQSVCWHSSGEVAWNRPKDG